MIKAKRDLVLASFVVSGLAAIASFVALGTQYWTSANIEIHNVTVPNKRSTVNYGLFGGTYNMYLSFLEPHELSMTCLMSENVCAMLSESTSAERTEKLEELYYNVTNDGSIQKEFINAGVWITTILFLVLSCIAGLIATVLAILNTVYNPMQTYLNIAGLYIWNGVAAGFSLFTLITWGTHFAITLTKDICIYDTINDTAESKAASLHFSYWLNFLTFLLYVISIVLLTIRQRVLNKDPVETYNTNESIDPGLLSY